LKYWENLHTTRPRLARMALDFLLAPASSVDAERAFSGGRLQVNHLQHQLSSQSFKAQVAVGSQQSSRKRCPKGRSVRSSQLRLRRTSILQW
ncbi:hypothetical protein SCLCIDRAFT_143294, partial [Scleroderma citrinum Foug A]